MFKPCSNLRVHWDGTSLQFQDDTSGQIIASIKPAPKQLDNPPAPTPAQPLPGSFPELDEGLAAA